MSFICSRTLCRPSGIPRSFSALTKMHFRFSHHAARLSRYGTVSTLRPNSFARPSLSLSSSHSLQLHRQLGSLQTCRNENRSREHRYLRYYTTNNQRSLNEKLEQEGVPTGLSAEQLHTIISHAKSVWPPPPHLPMTSEGWSSAWENWTYLLTFYWHSPHYLMIPQIDMIVNILYRLPGETRAILFSNAKAQFAFTLYEDPKRFFLYDMNAEALYEFNNVENENQLVDRIEEIEGHPDNPERWHLRLLEPDPEGQDAIRRIMERDESVIPLLGEKFLDYTPQATTPWQENLVATSLLNEDQRERLETLAQELGNRKEEIGKEEEEKIMKQGIKELEKEGN